MVRLSIIVPVYNVENYLSKCLDSLLEQDIPKNDYEIIIVNDGSTDNSLTIAESYVDKYSNIRIITQKNLGLGASRNTGIRKSKGKYLLFVDSDDYLQPDCLGMLMEYIETKGLDILRFNHVPVNDKGELIQKTKNTTYRIIFNDNVVNGETFISEYLGWACYAWVYMLNAAFVKNYLLFFNEEIFFEDIEWLIRALLAAKRVRSIDKNVYYYLQRKGSITKSQGKSKRNKVVDDMLYIVDWLHVKSETVDNLKVRLWFKGMITQSFMGILSYAHKEIPERVDTIINMLRSDKYYPLKSYHFTFKQWRNMALLNISPKFFCILKGIRLKFIKS